MNYNECLKLMKQYLLARIPFISLSSVERTRALELLKTASNETRLPIFVHTMTKGMQDINNNQIINDDKTIIGALDFIANEIRTKENMTYILSEVQDLDMDSMVSRYFLDVVTLAEQRGATIIVISGSPVWTQLQRLGMNITLALPDNNEMLQIIKENIDPYRNQVTVEWDDIDLKEAATILTGISKVEVKNVIASLLAKGKLEKSDLKDLKFAKDRLFSNINGLEKIEINPNTLAFGGLAGLKNWLDEKKQLLHPLKKDELSARGITPPRGLLLTGVPGCGKSLSAKAIAHLWELPLFRLDFATVQGRYVGQSEQQLKEALDTAEHVSPCVLWIDEIEKGLSGGKGDSDVTTRMVGQFLFWLQENKSPVFVVATANDVTTLPAELLRRGRFDEIFFIDLPSTEERKDIIKLYIEKYLKVGIPENLMNNLIDLTAGFSGADIESCIRDIAYKLIANPNTQITDQLIIENIKTLIPLSKSNPETVDFIRSWGKNRAISASGKTEN